jgi:murein DD-endopeptidase MepM/ murein hydrolase activator NlpD
MDTRRFARWGPALVALLWAALVAPILAAPPVQEGGTVHVVQAGETLYVIAQRYGVTVEAIVDANAIGNPNWIEVGQRLAIPADVPSAPISYTVQPGDTLAIISRRYNVTVETLAQLNHLANPNLIYVGQALLVPAIGGAASPLGGAVYVVQVGDTMARIAARYGTSVWAVAQANAIGNPSLIYVGQRLLIPAGEQTSSLPLPFLDLQLVPVVAAQGQTVQLVVETDGEVDLDGVYDGRALFFVGAAGQYRTLIGIRAMAAPGMYALDLKAVQGEREVTVRSMIQVVESDFGVQYIAIPSEKMALLDPELVATEAERVWNVTTQATLPGQWQGAFAMPLAGDPAITAPFGIRRSYSGGPASSYHGGVDYAVPEGTPIYCPAPGTVVLAEALQVRGGAVIVDHGRGVMSAYWHLSEIKVAVGQRVERGDVLGEVGTTGLSTGAHLHWELRVMGIQVDPLQWVREHIE